MKDTEEDKPAEVLALSWQSVGQSWQ